MASFRDWDLGAVAITARWRSRPLRSSAISTARPHAAVEWDSARRDREVRAERSELPVVMRLRDSFDELIAQRALELGGAQGVGEPDSPSDAVIVAVRTSMVDKSLVLVGARELYYGA